MPIDPTYADLRPTTQATSHLRPLREAFSLLDQQIRYHCPDGRLKALALTELEAASKWAFTAIVLADHEPDDEP